MPSKTIFITGTNSGFGKATVEQFAQAGWQVAATVRDLSAHGQLFKEFPSVTLFELDVTDFAQVEAVTQAAIAKFGTIDVVVNNAGYCLMGPTETSSMEQIKRQFDTNVFGVFAVTKAFIPHFRSQRTGMFINLSSASAQFNYPFIAAYGSSKWAVRGMTESLGIELAPFNIEVKAIYPGLHATKIFTKLDDGGDAKTPAFGFYEKYFKIFLSAQESVISVTSPTNIANEIFKAATHTKGKLHIISGGDAKLYAFLKIILPERMFQKMQLRNMLKPLSSIEISFAKRIFGSNLAKLEVGKQKQ
ncbi:SDR family oxidoreductase [Rheinheimera baltica]|uniref:SDR family oxidoreductase n=1 Tax=Rheinheimera baltica TaxID=67576 RepID=UPI00040CC899|nr:SDR family oxidoreductase [Rheinheimera baltica]